MGIFKRQILFSAFALSVFLHALAIPPLLQRVRSESGTGSAHANNRQNATPIDLRLRSDRSVTTHASPVQAYTSSQPPKTLVAATDNVGIRAGAFTAAAGPTPGAIPSSQLGLRAAYPRLSRQAGEQGRTTLEITCDDEGYPRRIEILESSGFRRLDEAALDSLKGAQFAGDQRLRIAFEFKLTL